VIWGSTTFRFAALVFLFQIVAAAVLLFGLGAVLRTQSRSAAVDVAETMRDDLLTTYDQGGLPALRDAIEVRTEPSVERTAVLYLADPQGRSLAGNLDPAPHLAVTKTYALIKARRHGHTAAEAMFLRASRLRGGGVLVIGTVVEGERQFIALLEHATIAALGLSILFAAFAAFVSTRLILNRLKATITTLGSVRAGDLSRRVPPDGTGDAFALLGTEVNQALNRVEALNAELKIATDSLAHDLKSPLTRLQSALDRMARIVAEPAAQTAVDQALAESERLLAMIETALSITRAEAGLGRESFKAVDMPDMLATIVEIYAPVVEDEERTIVLDASVPVTLPIHRQLMDQAIGNLVDNAIKYGAGTITLSVTAADHEVTIAVADEGRGIPQDQREQALRRFARLDSARGGWGAGLGLSLVQAVAHLHGGRVELRDHDPGLEVAIVLDLPDLSRTTRPPPGTGVV
jgi:signal transduction histidine kinase